MNTIGQPKIGLALGGGGVRGLAHIGVLKVLEAEKIPIDCLTGSSIGGLIAAAYACGRSAAELEEETLRMAKPGKLIRLVDFSSRWSGMIDGNRLRHYLSTLVGVRTTFDDLRIPLALIAVDLSSSELITLKEGSLLDAVQAAVTIPGLISPVIWGEHLLIDGGILNNVPVDILYELGAERTIAVNVNPVIDRAHLPAAHHPGETWPAWMPGFAKDLYLAEMIMVNALTRVHLAKNKPDLLIEPELPYGISVFWGFQHAKEAIAAGEEAARKAILAWYRMSN